MMKVNQKISRILLNSIPILIMIILIPFVKNDYVLTILYILTIILSLFIKYERHDYIFLIFGLFAMIFFEYIFISTGVEYFIRASLFGIMPLWLPVLWAYGFVTMKRAIKIIEAT